MQQVLENENQEPVSLSQSIMFYHVLVWFPAQ